MSAHMGTSDRVVLLCNVYGCRARYVSASATTIATRQYAAMIGWRVDDRLDFCPDHSA